MVVEDEIGRMKKFRESLRLEDKLVFDDLLNQCKLYASYAGTLASPIREVPLLLSMIFAQHKRLMELETQIKEKPGHDDPLLPFDLFH